MSKTTKQQTAAGSATRVKMTFRIVELHTFERAVDTAELKRRHEQGDVASWLEDEFIDDPMSDSDICTESADIDNWETLPNNKLSHSPKKLLDENHHP